MDGFLDELDRTRLTIDFGQGPLDAIVDTAFTGALLVGEEVFNREAAVAAGTAEAELAAEQEYEFDAYDVHFFWFGLQIEARVLVGPGKECLLGTALLTPHHLDIDYEARTVRIVRGKSWLE